MEACHSCSDTRGTSVFQLAAVDEHKALIVEHGIKHGSRNEAMAVPNTLAEICGREVTVFHFVGGATLVEALCAAFAEFQEDMKQKRPDTLQRYNQVLATLNGGLMDVTLLDERTSPDVLDHLPEDPIIEETWHQKRKQEGEERRLQKKRRESTSKGEEAPDSHADCQSQRSQSGYQTAYMEFIRTNFVEAFVNFNRCTELPPSWWQHAACGKSTRA